MAGIFSAQCLSHFNSKLCVPGGAGYGDFKICLFHINHPLYKMRRALSLRATVFAFSQRRPASSLPHNFQHRSSSFFFKQQQTNLFRPPSLSRNFSTTRFSNNKDEKYQSMDDLVDGNDEIRVDNEYMKSYDDEHAPKSLDDKQHLLEHDEDNSEQPMTWQEKALPIAVQWGPRVLGSTMLAYVFTKTSLYITTELLNITLTDAVWFGFGSGFLTSSATGLAAFVSFLLLLSALSYRYERRKRKEKQQNKHLTLSYFLLFLSSCSFLILLFRSCGTRLTPYVLSQCIVLP